MASRIRTILVLSGLLVTTLFVQGGSATEGDVTTTSAPALNGADVGGIPADELAWYADEKGVSLAAAARMILAEGELSLFADQVRHEPWYAGFKIVTSGETVSGVLAVTGNPDLQVPPGLSVEIQTARMGESDLLDLSNSIVERLRDRVPDLIAVTYEPFEDVVLVWRSAGSSAISAAEASAIEAWTRGELDARFEGVEVRIVTSPGRVLATGEGPDLAVKTWPLITLGVLFASIVWLARRTGTRTPNS